MIFHFWWCDNLLPFERKQATSIKSFLSTQPDSEFILWGSSDFSNNEWIKPLLDKGLQFKVYNPKEEAKNTPVENNPILEYAFHTELCVGADLARNILLYKYGGCYVDLDVIALKDFTFMSNEEFAYAWPSNVLEVNNAVLSINKRSSFATDLLVQCILEGNPRSLTH